MRIHSKGLPEADISAIKRAKMLDTFLWSDTPEVDAAVDEMYYRIFKDEVRKRSPSKSDINKRKASIKVILLNLLQAWHLSPTEWVYLSLSRAAYSKSNGLNEQISYRSLKSVWDGLCRLNYVDYVEGNSNETSVTAFSKKQHGYLTRVRATEAAVSFLNGTHCLTLDMAYRLRPQELIILKDKHGNQIKYEDSPDIIQMRKNLTKFNRMLSKSDIGLKVGNGNLNALQNDLHEDGHAPIDMTSKSLHRPFNNGSFQQGGRFYGAWWVTVQKELRPQIIIDRESTVEIDYVTMNPRMLYAKEGVELDFDPYVLPGKMVQIPRKMVKAIFNQLAFGDKMPSRTPKGWKLPSHLKYKQVLQAVLDHTHVINKHYCKSMSGTLQYQDSCIAEGVLLQLADKGIVALPIHDSFVVKKNDQKTLEQVMTQVFKDATGVIPQLRIE